jgi:hypothetical protein
MSNPAMTFEEFRASLAVYPWNLIPFGLMDDGMDEGESLLSYANGSASIYRGDLSYRLVIGRSEWLSPDLLELEQILYTEWYLREVAA